MYNNNYSQAYAIMHCTVKSYVTWSDKASLIAIKVLS